VANYAWPDFRSKYFGPRHAGRLYLPSALVPPKYTDVDSALSVVLRNAGQGTDNLPKLYHGLVKRELLCEVKLVAGDYFHGSSPDVSMATALAYLTSIRKRAAFTINYPLTLPGASGGSNTGRSAMNQHKGELSGERQTSMFAVDGWPSSIPRFFSVETVWAHASISTLLALGAGNHLQKFNYPRLYASLLNLHSEYKKEIGDAMKVGAFIMGLSEGEMKKIVLKIRVDLALKRMAYIFRRLSWPTASGGRKFIEGIPNIYLAQSKLQKWLDKNKLSFKKSVADEIS
jgi:hypothetical protein